MGKINTPEYEYKNKISVIFFVTDAADEYKVSLMNQLLTKIRKPLAFVKTSGFLLA